MEKKEKREGRNKRDRKKDGLNVITFNKGQMMQSVGRYFAKKKGKW